MALMGRRKRPWGLFDRRLTIQALAYDEMTGRVEEPRRWDEDNPIAEDVPARIIRTSGSESFSSGAVRPESDITFRIRWRAGITTEQSIIENVEYGGRWRIVAIEPIGVRNRLDLVCERID